MRPIETKYKGCRFRSRLEARWAVFFDALGIRWWYEPEGFMMRFDYEAFAGGWDASEEELLKDGVPQTFKHLDGKEYMYLPDFYLPELDYWIEIKGPNPTKEELEKTFMLSHMLHESRTTIPKTETEEGKVIISMDFPNRGIFIIYGDVPWPHPQKGNIFGYGRDTHVSTFDVNTEQVALPEPLPHRALLMGRLNLCWQECPLCSKVGIGKIETPYCSSCYDRISRHILTHLVRDWGVKGGPQFWGADEEVILPIGGLLELEARQEAYEMTKGLMNRAFFTSGHKTAKLQEAYEAARSARFEHR
jgi:hypothetical protein